MNNVVRYLDSIEEPPKDFISWMTVSVKGSYLIVKDAVIRHSSEESIDCWPHVKVSPGLYNLEVKLIKDDQGYNRFSSIRMYKKGKSPSRGKKIGNVPVDFSTVGLCDYEEYISVVRKHEDDYEACADDLFDLMDTRIGITEFYGQAIYYIESGEGDGSYPAFELLNKGSPIGIECVFNS